ncbi:hypothetical protein [Umezawaea sp.]|uniref:hypothetical protein n=1 Tax=Umezawaea sp. TaxID=1955258 RepID=UPI002ED651C3
MKALACAKVHPPDAFAGLGGVDLVLSTAGTVGDAGKTVITVRYRGRERALTSR